MIDSLFTTCRAMFLFQMAASERQKQAKFVRMLNAAADRGNFDVCLELIDRASLDCLDVDHPGIGGSVALYAVVSSAATDLTGQDQAVHRLLSAGADINRVDPVASETALHRVAALDRRELVKVMVEWPAVNLDAISGDGSTPLSMAISMGNLVIARQLILAGCCTNK